MVAGAGATIVTTATAIASSDNNDKQRQWQRQRRAAKVERCNYSGERQWEVDISALIGLIEPTNTNATEPNPKRWFGHLV